MNAGEVTETAPGGLQRAEQERSPGPLPAAGSRADFSKCFCSFGSTAFTRWLRQALLSQDQHSARHTEGTQEVHVE